MILSNAPIHEAVMSNMKTTSEFTIKNSAKAFGILSSNLYSNKIRAIIRELSCNAWDSHVQAKKEDTEFIVHLPNILEPWFSVQDFGVGLNHNEVQNIYTTYFESTKNGTNDFIGGLGLGSKSPFAYTDNFTVTAIKDGIKNIYSAYINNEGVPSIVLMQSSDTEEAAGVTVSLAVNSKEDYQKFIQEAQEVFLYFKNKPKITGCVTFKFKEIQYKEKDIIPGVSTVQYSSYYNGTSSVSVAVMGNIGYKIDVPNPDKNLGDLSFLLTQGLEIHFNIGELDLQPSREGLSYNTSTIEAIKTKLLNLSSVLSVSIEKEINEIQNSWKKAQFLQMKYNEPIWKSPVISYVKNNPNPLWSSTALGFQVKTFELNVADIKTLYNIEIQYITSYRNKLEKRAASSRYSGNSAPNTAGVSLPVFIHIYSLTCAYSQQFCINDIKVGVFERCKFNVDNLEKNFFILSPVDKTKEMDLKGFFKEIENPPESYKILASNLTPKPKAIKVPKEYKPVSIVRLNIFENRATFPRGGSSADYTGNSTYYYLPVIGHHLSPETKITSLVKFVNALNYSPFPELKNIQILGVRKADLENIKLKNNWVNLEEYIEKRLASVQKKEISDCAYKAADILMHYKYNIKTLEVKNSKYEELVQAFKYVEMVNFNFDSLTYLTSTFNKGKHLETLIQKKVQSFQQRQKALLELYPMLGYTVKGCVYQDLTAVRKYITMVDQFNNQKENTHV